MLFTELYKVIPDLTSNSRMATVLKFCRSFWGDLFYFMWQPKAGLAYTEWPKK